MSKRKVVELPAAPVSQQNPTEKGPVAAIPTPAPIAYCQVILTRVEAVQVLTDFLRLALDPKVDNFAIRAPSNRIIPEAAVPQP